jgi:hypothetical protein
VSSASAPIASVGWGVENRTEREDEFARIQTPPAAVPTKSRPLLVGSATIALTRPVADESAEPSGTPPKVGTSFVIGSGPSSCHVCETCANSHVPGVTRRIAPTPRDHQNRRNNTP